MNITDVHAHVKGHKAKKRVGRGNGSGLGKTAGRGHKGAKARSGPTSMAKSEGGQMSLFRRIPKRGFNNKNFRVVFAAVNLSSLESFFEAGETISPDVLVAKGICRKSMPVKILAHGEITKKLTVTANAFSKAAIEKIEKAGGKAEVIK